MCVCLLPVNTLTFVARTCLFLHVRHNTICRGYNADTYTSHKVSFTLLLLSQDSSCHERTCLSGACVVRRHLSIPKDFQCRVSTDAELATRILIGCAVNLRCRVKGQRCRLVIACIHMCR